MSILEETLAKEISPIVAKNLYLKDLKGSEEYISEIVKRLSPSIKIKHESSHEIFDLDICHSMFETVLKHIQTGEPVFLTGPAGSGKSTIAADVAKALKFDFGSISVCAQTTKTDFLGYFNANGNYVPTLFRKIYEKGGVFLIDEIDAGNPNVLAVLNAALSGEKFAFPDCIVTKNERFLLVATANTFGKGSTEYVGRNQLDEATLDRFNFIYIDYDKRLEKAITNHKYDEQLQIIYKIREFVAKNKIKIIVSTRSIIKIIKLMGQGFDFRKSLDYTVFKGCDEDTIKTVWNGI